MAGKLSKQPVSNDSAGSQHAMLSLADDNIHYPNAILPIKNADFLLIPAPAPINWYGY